MPTQQEPKPTANKVTREFAGKLNFNYAKKTPTNRAALAGAAAYFNWMYVSSLWPSSEAMYNFFNLKAPLREWPAPEGKKTGESTEDFYKRMGFRLNVTRGLSTLFAVAALFVFCLGVVRVLLFVSAAH